jgi:hypothetical protein
MRVLPLLINTDIDTIKSPSYEDLLPLVAPGHNRIEGIRKMNLGFSRHAYLLPKKTPQVNTLYPDPLSPVKSCPRDS